MRNTKVAYSTDIDVDVVTNFIAQQSIEADQQFVFSYTITVKNNSAETVQLLSRYWLISDANGETNTVAGEGVIGQQPYIKSGESFTYSSGCVLKSPLGNMQGHYQMQTHSAELIQVDIPPFRLAKPNILN
ncbi:MAG: Co2+/Mg2+ efflux protein ApaG [Colwellia polaris]|jgi:ApaG protein|uniref:Co2+/Mg2+ efflux protein ApaG n=1 Tax=Colwellia polaris TaxID=326537 RepID=UPI000A16D8FC|nr:Co2+/Mg2+ efflux protein ApaG [Colwellia polaris]|tara:strand:+ start:16654 stop:17046 length:393 start_codon:yes stop_codon:yes gene_type:complete